MSKVWPPVFSRPSNAFTWPAYARSGISYGNLTDEQLGQLSPFMQQRLPDRATISPSDVVLGTNPEMVAFSDPVLTSPPGTGPEASHNYEPLKYGSIQHIALSIGAADQLVLNQPTSDVRRVFMFIVNTHPLQTLNVAFGIVSSATLGIPIAPLNGFIGFDVFVPQDDVHIIGTGAATTGILVFSNKKPNQPGE